MRDIPKPIYQTREMTITFTDESSPSVAPRDDVDADNDGTEATRALSYLSESRANERTVSWDFGFHLAKNRDGCCEKCFPLLTNGAASPGAGQVRGAALLDGMT